MNKTFAAVCAGAALSVSLAACGPATTNAPANPPASGHASSVSAGASAAAPASTTDPRCIAPSSVSNQNVYPGTSRYDYTTPAMIYTTACQAFLPQNEGDTIESGISSIAGDASTLAQQAQGYCWQTTLGIAQMVDSSATSPADVLMQACRDGIAAAGGPAADAAPTSGDGQATSTGD